MRPALVGFALGLTVAASAAEPDEPRRLAERYGLLLAAGDAAALIALYLPGADHRDLSTGDRFVAGNDLERFLEERLRRREAATRSAHIESFRRLGPDVALAQLTLSGPAGGGSGWPPFTALLLRRAEEGWGVAATRAGGNPNPDD